MQKHKPCYTFVKIKIKSFFFFSNILRRNSLGLSHALRTTISMCKELLGA
jgi:hypothetical protein